jgi:hypothetical protein
MVPSVLASATAGICPPRFSARMRAMAHATHSRKFVFRPKGRWAFRVQRVHAQWLVVYVPDASFARVGIGHGLQYHEGVDHLGGLMGAAQDATVERGTNVRRITSIP